MTSTDLSLDTLLSDPLILSVMKADRVDPARLKAKLTRIGDDIARRRARRNDRGTVADCLRAHFVASKAPRQANPAGGLW